MKYFLREMHGSFVRFRLIKADLKPSDDSADEPENVLAHMWQVPATNMSVFLNQTDFSEHWVLGHEKTSDGHMMGGHHEGRYMEISEEVAIKLLTKSEELSIGVYGLEGKNEA